MRRAFPVGFCPCCIGCGFGKSARGAVSLGEVGVEGSCHMNGSRCRVDSLARFRGQLYELSAAGDKQCRAGTFSKSGCEPVDSADTSLAHVGATFGPKLIIYTGLWATYWCFVDM